MSLSPASCSRCRLIVGPEAFWLRCDIPRCVSLEDAASAPVRAVLPAAGRVVWWLLCAGALLRLGWLCAGAVRLRQLRQRSRAAVLTPDLEAHQIRHCSSGRAPCLVRGCAAGRLRPAASGHPAARGLLRHGSEAQRTVACHELLHVVRRDWPWIVVEEVARALFWFHPAVWWLVERIQESREQLVDRLVIARIPSKRAYMAALLAFADVGRPPALWRPRFCGGAIFVRACGSL